MMNMSITSASMSVKTAHKVLQRALQVLLAVVALLIAFLVQSVCANVLAAENALPTSEMIRLVNEERREANLLYPGGPYTREEAQRLTHTRPDGRRWVTPFFELENIALRAD